MTSLEDLKPGATVRGLLPDALVTVIAVTWHGNTALTLAYRTPSGEITEQVLYRIDEERLEVVEGPVESVPQSTDEDAEAFDLDELREDSTRVLMRLAKFRRHYGGADGWSFQVGDADMVRRLVLILESGEDFVVRSHDFIMRRSLYADGMFWFEAFAVAYQVCCCIEREKAARYVPVSQAERLVLVLARMTAYRAHGGPDIIIRGDVALRSALKLFASNRVLDRVLDLASGMDPAAKEELLGAVHGLQYGTA
jgi:hypothetical protein